MSAVTSDQTTKSSRRSKTFVGDNLPVRQRQIWTVITETVSDQQSQGDELQEPVATTMDKDVRLSSTSTLVGHLLDVDPIVASPFLFQTSGRPTIADKDADGHAPWADVPKERRAAHVVDLRIADLNGATDDQDKVSLHTAEHGDGTDDQAHWPALIGLAQGAAQQVLGAMEMAQEMAAERCDFKAYRSSPRVAVLWKSASGPDFAALKAQDLHIVDSRQLPRTDCFIFIAERPPKFLMDNLCGSVASEIESLRCAMQRVVNVKDVSPYYNIWPLHDHQLNMHILAKAFTLPVSATERYDTTTCYGYIRKKAHAVSTWLGWELHNSEVAHILQAHFGSDTALSFLFTYHYIKSLWVLALPSFVFWIVKSVFVAWFALDKYRAYVQPFYAVFVLFPWAIWFFIVWKNRLQKASQTFLADRLTNDDDVFTEVRPDFRPWDPSVSMEYYPMWMRVLKTLLVAPLVGLTYMMMMTVIGGVFWWEMHIIFEWGGCSSADPLCDSASINKGLLGTLYEAVPGLVEGIIFEILLAVSKAIAKVAVKLQNWRTESQAQLAFMAQVYVCEFISKFGFVGMLGLTFVPDWGSELSISCNDAALEWSADWGWKSLQCMRQNTLYSTRLVLFENAVEAPFYVSQIVSMLMKTLLPLIVVRLRRCYPNDHGADKGCRFGCCRAFLRCMSCSFLVEGESAAPKAKQCEDCAYMRDGDLIGEELADLELLRSSKLSGGSQAPRASSKKTNTELPFFGDHVESFPLMVAWKEGMRESYEAALENLETSMHFFWVISFAALRPGAVVLSVLVYLFDVRLDLFRLTTAQRRGFQTSPRAGMQLFVCIMYWAIGFAIIFNLTVFTVIYAGLNDTPTLANLFMKQLGTHIPENADMQTQVHAILPFFFFWCGVAMTIHVVLIHKYAKPDYDAIEEVLDGRERIRLPSDNAPKSSASCSERQHSSGILTRFFSKQLSLLSNIARKSSTGTPPSQRSTSSVTRSYGTPREKE